MHSYINSYNNRLGLACLIFRAYSERASELLEQETIQQSSYFVTSMRMIAEHRKNKNEKERAIGSSKL